MKKLIVTGVFALVACGVESARTTEASPSAQHAALMPSEHPSWPVIEPFMSVPPMYAGDFGTYASLLTGDGGAPISTPAEWEQHRAELRTFWLDTIGHWPAEIAHPTFTITSTETTPEGITRYGIDVEGAPGANGTGFLLIPAGTPPFPAVLDFWYYPIESIGQRPSSNGSVDFSWQLAKRGFVTLAMGGGVGNPNRQLRQDLSFLAYVAGNYFNFLADRADVDPSRIGVVGHSFGGKWSFFAGALNDKFAAVAVSDPDIVWDETHANANYWEPYYLGFDPALPQQRQEGVITAMNPRTGAYKTLYESGHDLTELQALIAPRPFFVAGGAEDKADRWKALNRTNEVYALLDAGQRLGLSTRPHHEVTPEANAQVCAFFEVFFSVEPFDAGVELPDAGTEEAACDAGEDTVDAGDPNDAGTDAFDAGEEVTADVPSPFIGPKRGWGCSSSGSESLLTLLLAVSLLWRALRGGSQSARPRQTL